MSKVNVVERAPPPAAFDFVFDFRESARKDQIGL
jgi:hypothetical protein